jgi:hypothetical protein
LKKRKGNWAKLSRKEAQRRKKLGYSVEYATVQWFDKRGILAKRNIQQYTNTMYGDMTAVDGFALGHDGGIIWQSKYREEYMTQSETDRIIVICKKYNCEGVLFYRIPHKRGLHWKMLYVRPRP